MEKSATDLLEDLRSNTIGNCTRCPLHMGRTKLVFGTGNPYAALMFVGAAPDLEADQVGRPLVAAPGAVFDRVLKSAGISRDEAYLSTVVKCATRTPDFDLRTANACPPYLQEQIRIVGPKVIVALGADAGNSLTAQRSPLTLETLRGRAYWNYGKADTVIPVVATHSPHRIWHLLKSGASRPAKTLLKEMQGDVRRALAMARPVELDI